MENIASIIREKRVGLGMTQDELAQKLLVSRQAVSNWERNKTYPDLDKLKEMADLFDMTIDEMLYSDVKTSRNMQLVYKRLLYVVAVIIIAISSITFYRIISPPHISIISKYKGSCESETISLYKRSDEVGNGDLIESYSFGLNQEVKYNFGTYCVPLRTTVKVINNQWEDAVVRSSSLAPGFTIDAEHFFDALAGEDMVIFIHHTITVIEGSTNGVYRHSANAEISFKFTYPLDEESPFTTELIRRWRDD